MPYLELAVIVFGILFWTYRGAAWPTCRAPAIALLLAACLVEMVGLLFSEGNTWLYNTYIPLDFTVTFWLVRAAMGQRTWPAVGIALGLLVGCALMEVSLRNGADDMVTAMFVIGSLVLCAMIVVALFRLSFRYDQPLLKNPVLWLLFGQLVYSGGMIPFNSVADLLARTDGPLAHALSDINLILATLRYGSMSVALYLMLRYAHLYKPVPHGP